MPTGWGQACLFISLTTRSHLTQLSVTIKHFKHCCCSNKTQETIVEQRKKEKRKQKKKKRKKKQGLLIPKTSVCDPVCLLKKKLQREIMRVNRDQRKSKMKHRCLWPQPVPFSHNRINTTDGNFTQQTSLFCQNIPPVYSKINTLFLKNNNNKKQKNDDIPHTYINKIL